jgi:hypothetical protein
MSNTYEIKHSYLLFGIAASMVLWHRLMAKKDKNHKRKTTNDTGGDAI